jgi:peptide/nickel transport system substrate-binding protein
MRNRAAGLFLALGLTVTACTAPAQPTGQPAASGEAAVPAAPRVLTVGVQGEPPTLVSFGATRAAAGTATSHVRRLAHNFLTVTDERDARIPQLATDLIAVEKGNWKVNPDGTMDVTWKIRPGIQWHDGTPFTSADLLFAFQVFKDPAIPNTVGTGLAQMESARAPDPQTLEIHWSSIYWAADTAPGLDPLPRHLLEDLYQRDKDGFLNSPLYTTGWVGLGPFKIAAWEPGSHLQLNRFDGYFGGRAALDTIHMRFLGDPNTMIANILAEAVDVLLPISVRVDQALEVRDRWQGTGNRVTADLSGRLRHVEIQHRPEFARPVNGLTNRLVRQAFLSAIDKPSLIELMNPGLNVPPADSWFPPQHELRKDVESAIPQYPYDVQRAQQLLAQAGWVKNSGGQLVSQSSGESFRFQLWNTQSSGAEKELNVLADGWKQLGVEVEQFIIPTAMISDRKARAELPGAGVSGAGYDGFASDRLHSRQATSAANNYVGINRAGYANPRADEIMDRLAVTIPRSERIQLHRQMLQEVMGDVAIFPLFWDLDPILMLKSVQGVATAEGSLNPNVLQWDKTA